MKRLSCAALMLLAPLAGHAELSSMNDQALSEVRGQAIVDLGGGFVASENGVFQTYTVFDQTLYVPFDPTDGVTPPPGPGTGPRPIVIGNLFCDTCAIILGLKLGKLAYIETIEANILSLDPFPIGQALAELHYQKAAHLSAVANRLYYGPSASASGSASASVSVN
ncbi:DUF6160 family protein [Candidatus Macondimonas diazotrophica]|jgi:hypothetical protein|uniref:DUF6160 domain-containing protein n=1 Tax=Candidatus Macondimonas diazotrophica TaxID=2305248 RepID=A0A4Z0F799_9GAMM|nr:DUF6160 family protein [Candidatus Macondimonas diazotrophica]NCU01528.1 hypothetical protein [Candidatus Macondimonas diazotrophica]TFZ82098.1 hypothetical protein E4680_09680 [Candidatus Macondimonas diazotrophica]HBG29198.1 hypothetical protein [Gammaproteobacteria bacterium]